MTHNKTSNRLGRRAFFKNGTLMLAAASLGAQKLFANDEGPHLRVGLVTDMHHADKAPAGTRFYHETQAKLEEAGRQFQQDSINVLVELGDIIDAAESVEIERSYLNTISQQFSAICNDHHYVVGNHCVDTLTKEEFLSCVGQAKTYYSFDRSGFHFVILDACFRSDGTSYERKNFTWTDANIPDAELEWLEADLKAGDTPVILFVHQRLDVSNSHGVKNHADVRKILESSGRVLAVFQGHSHQNDLKEIAGIHYCTLVAMVEGTGPENNGYSIVEIEPNGTLRVNGFRKQRSYRWERQE